MVKYILFFVLLATTTLAQTSGRRWETLRPYSEPDTGTLVIKNDTYDTTAWVGPLAPSSRKIHVYSHFDGDSVNYRLMFEVSFDTLYWVLNDSAKRILLTGNGAGFSTVKLGYAPYYRFIVEPLAKQDVSDSSTGVIITKMSD